MQVGLHVAAMHAQLYAVLFTLTGFISANVAKGAKQNRESLGGQLN